MWRFGRTWVTLSIGVITSLSTLLLASCKEEAEEPISIVGTWTWTQTLFSDCTSAVDNDMQEYLCDNARFCPFVNITASTISTNTPGLGPMQFSYKLSGDNIELDDGSTKRMGRILVYSRDQAILELPVMDGGCTEKRTLHRYSGLPIFPTQSPLGSWVQQSITTTDCDDPANDGFIGCSGTCYHWVLTSERLVITDSNGTTIEYDHRFDSGDLIIKHGTDSAIATVQLGDGSMNLKTSSIPWMNQCRATYYLTSAPR